MAVMTAVVPNMHCDETHQLWVITTAVCASFPSDNRTSTSDTINSTMVRLQTQAPTAFIGMQPHDCGLQTPHIQPVCQLSHQRGRTRLLPPPSDSPQPLRCRLGSLGSRCQTLQGCVQATDPSVYPRTPETVPKWPQGGVYQHAM